MIEHENEKDKRKDEEIQEEEFLIPEDDVVFVDDGKEETLFSIKQSSDKPKKPDAPLELPKSSSKKTEPKKEAPSEIPENPDAADFGRFKNVRLLSAAGGMGQIYVAIDPFLQREVVIKVVKPSLMAKIQGGKELVERFLMEAQIGAQLEHPNILPVHEFGQFSDSRVFFVMKYIRGLTLRQYLADYIRTTHGSTDAESYHYFTASKPGQSREEPQSTDAKQFKPRVPPSKILRRNFLDKFIKLL